MSSRILAVAVVAGLAGAASADHTQYTNSSPLEWGIAGTSAVTSGPTTLFPSSINVSDTNAVLDVYVVLHGGTHTWFSDFELTLESPSGTFLRLLDFAGAPNSDDLNGDLGFDDAAASQAPAATGAGAPAGIWQVSDYSGTSTLGAGLPNDGSSLSIFDGESAAGDWNLYVYDQLAGDTGAFQGGWSIFINTVPAPASAALLGLAGLAGVSRRR